MEDKGDKNDKNETRMREDERSQYRINQQGAPKSLMPSSSVLCHYVKN